MQFPTKITVFMAMFASTSALFDCTAEKSTGPCIDGGCFKTGQVCTTTGCCAATNVVQELVCAENSKNGPCLNGGCLTDGEACIGTGADASCCDPTGVAAVTTTTRKTVTKGTTCRDLLNPATGVSDCPMRSALCTDAIYLEVMRVQCPKTCGFCGSSNNTFVISTCVDAINPATGTSDCPARRSLCNDATYRTLMQQQCCATCGGRG
ncbi:unnamed protein product, partial [Mesorhabditis spiculigera]